MKKKKNRKSKYQQSIDTVGISDSRTSISTAVKPVGTTKAAPVVKYQASPRSKPPVKPIIQATAVVKKYPTSTSQALAKPTAAAVKKYPASPKKPIVKPTAAAVKGYPVSPKKPIVKPTPPTKYSLTNAKPPKRLKRTRSKPAYPSPKPTPTIKVTEDYETSQEDNESKLSTPAIKEDTEDDKPSHEDSGSRLSQMEKQLLEQGYMEGLLNDKDMTVLYGPLPLDYSDDDSSE